MLSQGTLKSLILEMTNPDSPSFNPSNPPNAWMNAYHTYASTAEDVSGDLLLTSNPAGFQSALTLVNGNTPAQAAAAFDAAFVAYWTGATFAIGTPPVAPSCPSVGGNTIFGIEASSVVTIVTPGILAASLLALFSAVVSDFDQRADDLASAFHDATTSAVKVLITGTDTTPSPAGPLPITNLCEVF